MRPGLHSSVVLLVVAICSATAQQRTSMTEKKDPEPHRVEIPKASALPRGLPTIDLPEFVITGSEQLSLPEAEKLYVDEVTLMADLTSNRSTLGKRDRQTIELKNRQKEFLALQQPARFGGQVMGSLGNFGTPRIDIRLEHLTSEYEYRGEAGYQRTTGYAANTDRSRGYVNIRGGWMFSSSALEGGRVAGTTGWGTEKYRLFGSATPSAQRTHTNAHFGAAITSPLARELAWGTSVDYRYDTIDDDGVGTHQHRARLDATADLQLDGLTMKGKLGYQNAFFSGMLSEGISLFQIRFGTSRFWIRDFFVQGAGEFFVARGMQRQSLTRIYPDLSMGYHVDGIHLVSLSYSGRVSFFDLPEALASYPYVLAGPVLRHSDRAHVARATVESEWSPRLRTSVSAMYEYVHDYPLYGDPQALGVGQLVYGGRTRLSTFRAEGFAKFTPNDYVATAVVIRSTKNSLTRLAVPYLPVFEFLGTYTHAFSFGLNLTPQVTVLGNRETDLSATKRLAGVMLFNLRTEYELFGSLRFFLKLHNITNRSYELWNGYRAPPFLVAAGASYRW